MGKFASTVVEGGTAWVAPQNGKFAWIACVEITLMKTIFEAPKMRSNTREQERKLAANVRGKW